MSRVARSLSLTLLAAAALAAVPGAAQAQDDPVVCTGSVTVHYAPALGPLPRVSSQQVAERLGTGGGGACTGPFSSGAADTSFTQQVGCLLQGLGDTLVTNVVTYHWNGGASSTITYPVTTVVHAANQLVVTSTGTVTAGYGQGALSERIAAYADLDLVSCLSSGVAQQTGTLTVAIG
ncbi:hypothetical protein [Conexibacter woesei]|uniref:hypothetical protein n=1 Tax=Conexibacter woesei TaxID=191495 RepID=UPI00041D21BE|nr:hypothetical protein [Conexibacter woesei]